MEPDPIAENQTDVTIATLMTRDEGDPLMNKAVASLLAYTKKLGMELAEVKASLWSPDALDRRIEMKHESECRGCSVRKWVEDYKRQLEDKSKQAAVSKPSLWSFLMSERGLMFMMFIVIVFLTLMCARLVLGQEGYRDVTHTMKSAHSEVQK